MADPHLGKILGGRYRVDSLIEETQVADLYRGTNTAVEREVTIKIVKARLADFTHEIFEEARKISRISHPNVLAVTDLGEEEDGTVFVIYEHFVGENLLTVFNEQLPVERAIDIVRKAAAALTAVFAARDVHGMLKPENILLAPGTDEDETVKVLNFFGSGTFNRPNRNAVFVPSVEDVNYLAPELVSSDRGDERSDVYSLGSLLFRMLAGEVPFPAESFTESVKKALDEPPPPLSSFRTDLPEDLERVILTAMSKNPEMRYQTVSEFSDELKKFVGGSSESAAVAEAPKQDIWKTAFAVLAAISLLTVALIYATSVKQTNPTTQLQPDANGQPVQPIGPATGIAEQNLANMQDMSAETISNSNMAVPPGTLPGGDGYDPWKNGGKPPPGAPLGPGGQVVTIDPNNPSPFMTNDGPCIPQPSGIVLCPAPANRIAKPTPTPKPSAANANVSPKATPTPEVKPSPTVVKTPAKPAATPKTGQNGKPKNGDDL